MTISENGLSFIKSWEGCRLHAYLDSCSVPTIGWGCTVYHDGRIVKMGDTITQDEADAELTYQVQLKANQITSMVTVALTQNQIDAIIDFSYNAGTGAFHGSTLRRLINANPSDPNITAAFQMWDKGHVDGQLVVLPGLLHRRNAEATIYFT